MSQGDRESTPEQRVRATAFRHAHNIQDKKMIQTRIADLVIEAFDLPQTPNSDPGNPHPSDSARFKQCLKLFQASDFDDLVYERNVDDRCGYALCPRPNVKVPTVGEKAWNGKTGKGFSIVPKAELEKWCSRDCGDRAMFVRAQLGTEPAWVRDAPVDNISLLDEIRQAQASREIHNSASNDLNTSLKSLTLQNESSISKDDGLADRLQKLALERGELLVKDAGDEVSLNEKSMNNTTLPRPPTLNMDEGDLIEGHRPRKVRFMQDDGDSSDD